MSPADFAADLPDFDPDDPCIGFAWQDRIERLAYTMGGASDRAPAQRVADFLDDQSGGDLPRTSYPLGVVSSDLRQLFPRVCMTRWRTHFDRLIPKSQDSSGKRC